MKPGPIASQPLPPLPASASIAIVGTGLAGLAIAQALGSAARDAVLLDSRPAGGTAPASLGIVRVAPAMHLWRLRAGHGASVAAAAVHAGRRNLELLEALQREAPDLGLRRCGVLRLAEGEAEEEELRRSSAWLRELGVDAAFDVARRLFPMAPPRFSHGALHRDDAVVDPAALVRALERRVRALGTVVCPSAPVLGLHDDGDVRVHTSRGDLQAELVVLATDAALPQLVPFCRFKIVPMRAQALRAAPTAAERAPEAGAEPEDRSDAPLAWTAANSYEMWRLHAADGSVSVCGSRHLPLQSELGARTGTSPEVQALLEANLREFEPFASYAVVERWSGVHGVSCDGLPLAGAVPGRARLLVSGGFGMNGLGCALAAAEVVAQLILQGRAEHSTAFNPRRFL